MENEANPGRDGQILSSVKVAEPAPGLAVHLVEYASQGLRVRGYLAQPDSREPLPGLVFCRGGIGRVGMVRIPRIAELAGKGYAVFAPFYRGGSGSEGRDRFGGGDRYDVYSAIALLRALPGVSGGPVALIGFSRGAIMALLAAKECPGAGPAVVWGGVSDLRLTYKERVDLRRMLRRVVGHPKKEPQEYVARSPAAWAAEIASPVLIMHGTEDENVAVGHARLLAEALRAAGRDYELVLYEGLAHRFPPQQDADAVERAHRWIRRKLGEAAFASRET